MKNFKKIIIMVLPAILFAGCTTRIPNYDDIRLVREYGFPMFYKWNDPNLYETGLTQEQTEAAWKVILQRSSFIEPEEKQYFRVGTKDKKIYYFTIYCPECFGTMGAPVYPMIFEKGEWKHIDTEYSMNVHCYSVHFEEQGYGTRIYKEEETGSICYMQEWEWIRK